MKLSTPAEMDGMAETSGEGEQSSVAEGSGLSGETVSVFGEQMDPFEAVELLGEIVDQPEAFGLVSEAEYRDLEERVDELEQQNEELIESLHRAYTFMDEAPSLRYFSFDDVDDPMDG